MRLLHSLARTHASFDDPNLVSHAGLVPVMALAERAGLPDLIAEHVRPGGECGVNAHLKVACLVAGMAAGADSIDDMDVLRHGAMGALFGGVRAPSTLGSHLRSYTWGNVSSWRRRAGSSSRAGAGGAAAARRGGAGVRGHRLDAEAGLRVPQAGREVRLHQDRGEAGGGPRAERAGRGHQHAAVGAGDRRDPAARRERRLRAGAASLAARAIATARECGCTGLVIVRADSAYYTAEVIAAIRRGGARFSVTVPKNSKVTAAIAAIGEDDWTAIRYPRAIWDDQLRLLGLRRRGRRDPLHRVRARQGQGGQPPG